MTRGRKHKHCMKVWIARARERRFDLHGIAITLRGSDPEGVRTIKHGATKPLLGVLEMVRLYNDLRATDGWMPERDHAGHSGPSFWSLRKLLSLGLVTDVIRSTDGAHEKCHALLTEKGRHALTGVTVTCDGCGTHWLKSDGDRPIGRTGSIVVTDHAILYFGVPIDPPFVFEKPPIDLRDEFGEIKITRTYPKGTFDVAFEAVDALLEEET